MNKTWLLIGVIVVLGALTMIIVGNSDSRQKTGATAAGTDCPNTG